MIPTLTPTLVPAQASQAGATYMTAITIRVGFGSISLKSDSLKSESIAQALKENGVQSKDMLPLYEVSKNGQKVSLKQAGTVLSTMLDRLQAQYMLCGGSKRWWFVAEADWPAVRDGIAEMELERLKLLNQLQAIYHDAHDLFQVRLNNILGTANRLDELDTYLRKFPTWREIEQEFRIEVDGPVSVPSINDLAKQSPDMQRWMQTIHQQIQRDLPKLVDDICGTAADLLARVEQVEPGHLSDAQSVRIDKLRERLDSLRNLYDSMGLSHPIETPARSLINQALNASFALKYSYTTRSDISAHMSRLRADLKSDELLKGTGKGSRALSEWVHGASAEDKLRALVSQIKQLQQELADLSDTECRARLVELKLQVENHAELLSHAAGSLMQRLDNLMVKVDTGNTSEPIQAAPQPIMTHDLEVVEAGF